MSNPDMKPQDPEATWDTLLDATLAEALDPIDPPAPRLGKLRSRILRRATVMAQDHAPLVTLRAEEGRWREVAPGVELKPLYEDATSHAFIVRLAPGAELPSHPHPADEECLVLEGEMHLGELQFRAGDYHVARAGSSHGRVTSPTGGVMYVRSAGPGGYRT